MNKVKGYYLEKMKKITEYKKIQEKDYSKAIFKMKLLECKTCIFKKNCKRKEYYEKMIKE